MVPPDQVGGKMAGKHRQGPGEDRRKITPVPGKNPKVEPDKTPNPTPAKEDKPKK